jgi:thimet oligopeptidase
MRNVPRPSDPGRSAPALSARAERTASLSSVAYGSIRSPLRALTTHEDCSARIDHHHPGEVLAFFLVSFCAGCATTGGAPPVWERSDSLQASCNESIAGVQKIRAEVKAAKERTVEGTFQPYNRMLEIIDATAGTMALVAGVHPVKEVRDQADTCTRDLKKVVADLNLDRELFDAISAVDVSGADDDAKRFAEKVLRDFRRSGVDKDEATRAELKKLNEELVAVGQDFDRAITDDVRQIEVDPADLEGLPADFIQAHAPNGLGKVVLTTNYPDFFPVMTYVKKEDVRKALLVTSIQRAYPANDTNLKRLLELRKAYATKLGHPSWAQYMAEDKMVKSADAIEKFIEEVATISRPRMERDLETLKARKAQDGAADPTIQLWDRFYYTELVRREKYGFDAQSVRPYFDFERVTRGLMDLYGDLFGVRFVRDESAPVWHSSVLAYRALSGDELIGRFYLDMHPREGKYGHAAMFPMETGVAGGRVPVASLVCNFPEGLMDHEEVLTYFHEFGHLVHHLLARGSKWTNLAGINTEWDFVEAPSQLLEEWSWDPAVLERFAKHAETNEPIPAELVKKMKASSEFGKGVALMRQIHFTALSYYLHSEDPAEVGDLSKFSEKIQGKYSPYPPIAGTYLYTSFGHLNEYSSMYYTYQWSLSLAKDIFTRFETSGLLDTTTARDYRQLVLMPGGRKDAAQLVQDFLGRPTNLDAYRRWLLSE